MPNFRNQSGYTTTIELEWSGNEDVIAETKNVSVVAGGKMAPCTMVFGEGAIHPSCQA